MLIDPNTFEEEEDKFFHFGGSNITSLYLQRCYKNCNFFPSIKYSDLTLIARGNCHNTWNINKGDNFMRHVLRILEKCNVLLANTCF